MPNKTKASIEQTNKYHTSPYESARRIARLKRKRKEEEKKSR